MARVGAGPMARAGSFFAPPTAGLKASWTETILSPWASRRDRPRGEALEFLRKARLDGVIRGVEAEREYVK
jgi:hypothetical protein